MSVRHAEVIGDPIAQSKSPLIHGLWLDRLGLPGRYGKTHVAPADLAEFLGERRRDPDWAGCNVTIPHKQAVMPLLDRVTPLAAAIGAVNTVVREADGTLTGDNSDAPGFLEPLAAELARPHLFRMARLMGTGGAARAIAYALAGQGFTIVVLGRDPAKAQALAAAFDPDPKLAAPLDRFAAPFDFDWGDRSGVLDLVVNATSLGMIGQPPLPIDFGHVPPGAIVYDAVYAPLETPLLAEARVRGHRTVDGLSMLIGQAAIAFERLFGVPPPRDPETEAALRATLLA
ncbi:MAG: shikimate dehydrogenase [Sphingomonas fennica]